MNQKLKRFLRAAITRKPRGNFGSDIEGMRVLAHSMGLETNPVGADDSKTMLPGSHRNVGVKDGSCPPECQFLPIPEGGNGACYYTRGYYTMLCNQRATPELVKSLVSDAIAILAAVAKKQVARLHVGGDFFRKGKIDKPYIKQLIEIASYVRWSMGQDIVAYTYCHDMDIEHFAPYKKALRRAGIRVRNSDHNVADGAIVWEHDKLPALRAAFPENKYIPCLWQINKAKTCDKCQLCWDERYLRCIIVFNPDNKAARVALAKTRSLPVLNKRVA